FDRTSFKQSGESIFDEMFNFKLNLKERMKYVSVMKIGTLEQRVKMVSSEKEQEISEEYSMVSRADNSLQTTGMEALEQAAGIAGELTKAAADILGGLIDPGNIAASGESTVSDEERKRRRKKKGRGR